MRFSGAAVVAGWGILNGALVAVLAGFGAKPVVLAIYASSAGLVEVAAIAFWLMHRRQAGRYAWREPPNGDSVLLIALGVLIVALSWPFAWPLAIVAVVPFAGAVLREVSLRRGVTPAAPEIGGARAAGRTGQAGQPGQ